MLSIIDRDFFMSHRSNIFWQKSCSAGLCGEKGEEAMVEGEGWVGGRGDEACEWWRWYRVERGVHVSAAPDTRLT